MAQNFLIYLMAPKWRPSDVVKNVCGVPFSFDSPKVAKKRFSRDVPNTKVIPFCMANKIACILGVPDDVSGRLRDALFLRQSKSGGKKDFRGTSPIVVCGIVYIVIYVVVTIYKCVEVTL